MDIGASVMKLAVLTSHPIQYQTPLFRALASEPDMDLTVYFSSSHGLTPSSDPEFGRTFEWDIPLLGGYNHILLKNIAPRPGPASFFGEINPGILRRLFRSRPDALIVFGWAFVTDWIAFLAAFLLRIPVFIRSENPYAQEVRKHPLKRFLKRILLGILFRMARGLLFIGKENRKFYEYYGVPARKLFFAPYAVDNQRFTEAAAKYRNKKKELRKELQLPEEGVGILFTGKLVDKKNPLDLLSTLELMNDPRAFLVFVGDGSLREMLERYAIKRKLRVFFTGFKNQTEIPLYYAAADIFVLPSGDGETWGLSLNEAMCFGLPIVVSSVVGSAPDLVRDNGATFPVHNSQAMAAALGVLIKDEDKRKKMGEMSSELIKKYSYEEDIRGIREALLFSDSL